MADPSADLLVCHGHRAAPVLFSAAGYEAVPDGGAVSDEEKAGTGGREDEEK